MDKDQHKVLFLSADKRRWIETILDAYRLYSLEGRGENVKLCFARTVAARKIFPLHIAALACLVEHIREHGWEVTFGEDNPAVYKLLIEDTAFLSCWQGCQTNVNATANEIFRLWRVKEEEKDMFARSVESYMRESFPSRKDFSSISTALSEAYSNIFDHADAGQNAFSMIRYDEVKQRLYMAVSDYGIGIVRSVRVNKPNIGEDIQALEKSVELNFTVGSTPRNRGWGLDNILTNVDRAIIYSGSSILIRVGERNKYITTECYYPGTLLYLVIDLSGLEEEDVIDDFIL